MDRRRMVTWRWIDLVLALCLLLGACVAPTLPPQADRTVTAEECPAADADPDGYLRAICLYLVAEGIDVAPGRANSYTIKRVEEAERDGQRVVWVFLNCCYLGDIAVIDPDTGQVLEFRVGAQ